MKGARGVVFVYDITRLESFQHIRKWLKLVEQCESIDAGLEYMLIGNKSDLTESRAVTTDAARALAGKIRHDLFVVWWNKKIYILIVSARLQYLQCVSNGDAAGLH